MKNHFVRNLTLCLALAVTAGSVVTTPVSAASAPAFKSAKAIVRVGETKTYGTKNASTWSFYKATSSDKAIATVKLSQKKKFVKITGVTAGETVVTAKFKNYKTKKPVSATLPVTVKHNTVTKAAADYFAGYKDRKAQITDVFQLMDEGKDILIIDIRGTQDYEKEHLKGAINIPYAKVAEYLDIIPNDVPVYVNCYSGQTASQTTALLAVAGKDAYNIQGGYNNGIAKAENYKSYVDAVAVPLPTKEYPVDAQVQKAITKYYADAAASAGGNFNFSVADLAKLVEAGSNEYTIVDIRSTEDYAKGHIEGANINIPFPSAMPDGFSNIPKDKPVIVYCYSGQTASQTIAILRLLGYEAYNLSGGMNNGWAANELPVVTN